MEKKLREKVEESGGLALKLETNFRTGLPDRVCLFPGGQIVFVEVKSTGEKPRKLQEYWHRVLRNFGFDVRVIDRSEQIEKLMEDAE